MSPQTIRRLAGLSLTCLVLNLAAGSARAGVVVEIKSNSIEVDLATPTPNDVIVDFSVDTVTVVVNGELWAAPIGVDEQVTIIGSNHDDTLLVTGLGNGSSVYFKARHGNDVCDNNSMATVVFSGGPGEDLLDGGPGQDFFDGGTGDDEARGRGGNDVLIGGSGADMLFGGPGDDILVGDQAFLSDDGVTTPNRDFSVDMLTGGIGCDVFYDRFYYVSFSKTAGGLILIRRHYFSADLITDYDKTCDEQIATLTVPPPRHFVLVPVVL